MKRRLRTFLLIGVLPIYAQMLFQTWHNARVTKSRDDWIDLCHRQQTVIDKQRKAMEEQEQVFQFLTSLYKQLAERQAQMESAAPTNSGKVL